MESNNNLNIPMEIVLIILVRLPIISIFRFKCVCKSWYDLIQSHEFLKQHRNRSLKTDTSNCSLILPITKKLVVNGTPIGVASLYRANLYPNQTSLDLRELALPPSFQPSINKIPRRNCVYGNFDIVGSCNGLILILSGKHHFAVCNPAIENEHAFKILPCLAYPKNYEYHRLSYKVFGFGYDSVTNRYKIVYLTDNRALAYNLASDDRSWRMIELPDEESGLMQVHGNGVSTNNHLHWNITEHDSQVLRGAILSFDIRNEEWGEVPIPNEVDISYSLSGYSKEPYIKELGVLDGCLCLLASQEITYPGRVRYLDLWIMKEYGVKESWTKLCEVPKGSGIPLYYRKDRNEFLLPGTKHALGWFNPIIDTDDAITRVKFYGCGFTGEHYHSNRGRLCVESFVDPF